MSPMLFIIFVLILNNSLVLAGGKKTTGKREDTKDAFEGLGQFFEMMSGGKNGTCAFTCPEGQTAVPRPGHVPSSNGCGSMGIMLDTTMFPGFEPCCDAHDKCYDTCNKDRKKCDDDFSTCLNKVCVKAKQMESEDRIKLCENGSGVMQAAATGLGCGSYKQAQEKACICTENAALEDDDDDDEIEDDFEKIEL